MPKQLAESSRLAVEAASGSGRLSVGIITPGWGSSGYYSTKVLENAAQAKVIPAGTQMFLDHPSESELTDRPERSLRDLAAVTTSDAVWDGTRLAAEAQVFGPFVDLLTDPTFADAIGVSLRGAGEATVGEAEGRKGVIFTELVEVQSVDFVTNAGRGGSILAVLESARPALVVDRAIRRGVEEATANDTREALQALLRETYGAEEVWVWVRDFDATTVWYEQEGPDSSAVWAQGYTLADDGTASLAEGRIEVRASTVYVPVGAAATEAAPEDVPAPAGQSTPATESVGDVMAHVQIEEAELSVLRQDAERVRTAESERDSFRSELATYRARESARPIAAEVVNASQTLPQATRDRVIREAVESVQATSEDAFDAAAFRTAVEARRTAAETEVAQLAEALGVGRVTGFGSAPADQGNIIQAAEAAAASAFGRAPKHTTEV